VPEDAETHYLLGAAYIQPEQVKEAQSEFQAALKFNPDLAPAYIGLGNVQMLQNDLEGGGSFTGQGGSLRPIRRSVLCAGPRC